MAETTPNIGLKKPLENESADINIINGNMDKIDQVLGSMPSVLTAAKNVAGAIDELHADLEALGTSSTGPTPITLVKRDTQGRAKIANPSASDDITNKGSVESAIATAITNLVDGSPVALDTLKKLATALGNDPNFATTITNLIASKLNSSAYTAADVLAKVKTVDGTGSGLDADLLDGVQAAAFALLGYPNTFTKAQNFTTPTGEGTKVADAITYTKMQAMATSYDGEFAGYAFHRAGSTAGALFIDLVSKLRYIDNGGTSANVLLNYATGLIEAVTAQNNTSYTTKQIRNITLSTAAPSGGGNGDVWIVYTP
ncbi:hypothetical protein [Cohnella herbarum]|uniref:hypothetical protein n=1 Tax=Cohnella herbarum TaxID=2728023 RepID=UPI001C2BB181|nr:hypothetical protein [Cohnella herbarum]